MLHSAPSYIQYINQYNTNSGPDSSVDIATGYGLDGPEIESRRGRDFPHLSRPALGSLSLLHNGYRIFPGGKERSGCDTDPSPPSSAVVMKVYSYTSTPTMGRTVCTGVNFTFFYFYFALTCRHRASSI